METNEKEKASGIFGKMMELATSKETDAKEKEEAK